MQYLFIFIKIIKFSNVQPKTYLTINFKYIIIKNMNNATNNENKQILDIAIIGGGPAGLTAGIYAARAGLNTVIFEKLAIGGQIFLSAEIENYPGQIKISGPELISIMENQAKNFGVNFIFDEITRIELNDKEKILTTATGEKYSARSIIIAAGAKYKDLNIPGESKFKGKGVSNCATCDGAFYKNLDVAVIGGGDTAIEESLFLTRFVNKVYVIHRRDKLRATQILQNRAFKNNKIHFIFDSVAEEIVGDKSVTGIKIKNVKTNKIDFLNVSGVFVFIGFTPNTDFLKGIVDMDENGYILVDNLLQTSKEGIFACGDCIKKSLRQVVTACGDGATAAFSAIHYVENLKI